MTDHMTPFITSEAGAVTVDWVVLTAGLVGLGLAVMTVVSTGVEDLSSDVDETLTRHVIATSFGGYADQEILQIYEAVNNTAYAKNLGQYTDANALADVLNSGLEDRTTENIAAVTNMLATAVTNVEEDIAFLNAGLEAFDENNPDYSVFLPAFSDQFTTDAERLAHIEEQITIAGSAQEYVLYREASAAVTNGAYERFSAELASRPTE